MNNLERECCGTLPGSQHRITCEKSRHRNKVKRRYHVMWDSPDGTQERTCTRWSEASAILKYCLGMGYRVAVSAYP